MALLRSHKSLFYRNIFIWIWNTWLVRSFGVLILDFSTFREFRFIVTGDKHPSNKASSNDFFGFLCWGIVILLFVNVYWLGVLVPCPLTLDDSLFCVSSGVSLASVPSAIEFLIDFSSMVSLTLVSFWVIFFSILLSCNTVEFEPSELEGCIALFSFTTGFIVAVYPGMN